jgi:hypothetical protein
MELMTAKRAYTRRSDEQRIADLQAKIELLKSKAREDARPDMAVVRSAPRLAQRLRDFAQLANDHGRADIANTTVAFLAGLDRMVNTPPEAARRARRPGESASEALSASD